jgi:hypothetical protein
MNSDDRAEAATIAELEVHKYFDHYLTDIFPRQLADFFEAHNDDSGAHAKQFATHVVECPVIKRFDRVKWLAIGLLVACSAAGTVSVERLLKVLGLI